ncbi:MAG: CDP-diacylglycerol--glycerol-3-phosphate 3-phosphatidyltransferase [Waddliaceae bacterium]|nr:CDP-diacylglycerol--glycerol-3-phosphate 3-phosphatidyltransferase [Waddliaceae bacterium]
MGIATYLTFLRIFISPLFMVIYLAHQWLGISAVWLPYILLTLFAISELSDFADGFCARRYNQVSDLGKILDPMADSISRIAVFLAFTRGVVDLPILLVFVFIYRDAVISTLRTVCALRGIALAARASGKIKALLQSIAVFFILLMMIPHSLGYLSTETLQDVAMYVVAVVAAYALFSGAEYVYANRMHVKAMLTYKKRNVL